MYSIGEVSRLLGIKPHILRYWEREIPVIAPRKNHSGRRTYTQADIQKLFRIRHLIQQKKYTVEGARRQIWKEMSDSDASWKTSIAEIRTSLFDTKRILGKGDYSMQEHSLKDSYSALGQEHLFYHWSQRDHKVKKRLMQDLALVGVEKTEKLIEEIRQEKERITDIGPIETLRIEQIREDKRYASLGEESIAAGKTAVLTVAGGQGSRLGFDGPKGMYPISPIRKISLFQISAEKLLASQHRYGRKIPWYIMTSPQNHNATRQYFDENSFFGLDPEMVCLFPQGTLPTLDENGRLLLNPDGGLLMNPDGHGGLLDALRTHNIIEDMQSKGVDEIFYFQVDNPLVNVPDPKFLGCHLAHGSSVSSKVIKKDYPEEKLGVAARVNGMPGVVEYSDLSPEHMYAADETGTLLFSHGSIAIHLFSVKLLGRQDIQLPYHVALKKVKALNPNDPDSEIVDREAYKLEKFIFDIIPLASNALFYETQRQEEFAPLKNKTGVDSIETCLRGQVEKAAHLIESCGYEVTRNDEGHPVDDFEISPLYAIDSTEFCTRISKDKADPSSQRLFE